MTRQSALNLFSLKNKVAIISGGSRGIGWEITKAYASAGSHVIFYYNSSTPSQVKSKCSEIIQEYGVQCQGYQVDITNPSSIESTTQAILQTFGKIDIFVANAGIPWTNNDVLHIEDDELAYTKWRNLFAIDVDSVHLCARSIGRVFQKQEFGNFIVTTSMSAHIVNVPQFQAPYNAAKAAVTMYAKSLAVEWSKFGARVNMVSPGYVATDLIEQLDPKLVDTWLDRIPVKRLATADELVGAYLYLASDASSYCCGTDLIVDGGYTIV
ncbi:unnamed protein product [Ambrosiozyma monospora]|uniref:Unnamed protein product n=1 Tax=Ambrosiozyma monospora TaxID=43982 RepID=A0A9W6YR06_AMBMO|nr:unnamed protein product [Ambrosiozyma monospora]